MLIVSNGAFKSGSTWLFNILRVLTNYPSPPERYLKPSNQNPTIREDQLHDLLNWVKSIEGDYLVKNHFSTVKYRDALLHSPDVRIVNIERDIRDVVVSAYYHLKHVHSYDMSFSKYYSLRGKLIVDDIRSYHHLWNLESSQIIKVNYEALHSSFIEEVSLLAEFLDIPVTNEYLSSVKDSVTVDVLRKQYDDRKGFFRKGVVGDWKNHLSGAVAKDVLHIYENGLNGWQRLCLKATWQIRHNSYKN